MATSVSEIVYLTLKSGVDLEASSPWVKALAIISRQNGYQRSYYGPQFEDRNLLIWIIDWDSKDSHLSFVDSTSYEPFKSEVFSLVDKAHFHHIIQPETELLGRAPVLEFATFYDVEPGMISNIEHFAAAVETGKPRGYHGVVYGNVLEKIVKHKDVGNNQVTPGNAIVILLGWDSKEAHLEFRETELFRQNVGLLREKNGGVEMGHVSFKMVKR